MIERNFQYGVKLFGIERAASEITPAHFDCGHFAEALIHAQNQFFRLWLFIHVDFFKSNAALREEIAWSTGNPRTNLWCKDGWYPQACVNGPDGSRRRSRRVRLPPAKSARAQPPPAPRPSRSNHPRRCW